MYVTVQDLQMHHLLSGSADGVIMVWEVHLKQREVQIEVFLLQLYDNSNFCKVFCHIFLEEYDMLYVLSFPFFCLFPLSKENKRPIYRSYLCNWTLHLSIWKPSFCLSPSKVIILLVARHVKFSMNKNLEIRSPSKNNNDLQFSNPVFSEGGDEQFRILTVLNIQYTVFVSMHKIWRLVCGVWILNVTKQ